jgi:hypothetical protein
MNDFPDHSEEGSDILFADDDTSKDPNVLKEKLHAKADSVTQWIADNKMICSGEKTQLLVVVTRELRTARLVTRNRKLTGKVCGQEIIESDYEKLMGITISNNLTWNTHLYGNNLQGKDKLVSLVPQLSQSFI